CWEWQGSHSGNGRGGGYPRMSLDGQTVAVHRVMYIQINGYVPSKKQIDHVCRNRCCVNPAHLEMVTHKENIKRRDNARKDCSK
ncbi:MAG: HNH endonuclease, partial [Gammaproteobacteria bacterium]|nr:HNH endonuclease [Gammaproteobacteria bacterium]